MTSELIAQAQKLARECVAKNYKNCRLSRLSEMHHGNEWVLGSISRNSALIFRIRLLLILLPYWPAPIQHSPKKKPRHKGGAKVSVINAVPQVEGAVTLAVFECPRGGQACISALICWRSTSIGTRFPSFL